MAKYTITVNSGSSSQEPSGDVGHDDTIDFVAGTNPPSNVYFKNNSLFNGMSNKRVPVPSSGNTVKANSGNFPFYNEAQADADDGGIKSGTQIGTIKVG